MSLQCSISQQLLRNLASYFGFNFVLHPSLKESLDWWSSQKESSRPIPQLVLSSIWKWRINILFENKKKGFGVVFENIISLYNSIPDKFSRNNKEKSKEHSTYLMVFPRAYFDGTTQNVLCGCGVLIVMDDEK